MSDRRSRSRDRGDRRFSSSSSHGDKRQSRSPLREGSRYGSSPSGPMPPSRSFGDARSRGGDRGDTGFRGGGGRGGGGGGFGGGRGGGGRGGKNPQMGDMSSVSGLLSRNNSLISDAACLRIIDPSFEYRYRDDLIVSDAEKKFFLPGLDAWRISESVGIPVNNVRANFFVVDPRCLPTSLYHYNVAIYNKKDLLSEDDTIIGDEVGGVSAASASVGFSGSTSSSRKKDFCKEKDTSQLNTKIVAAFIAANRGAQTTSRGEKIGVSYDGKSSMYASHGLELPFASNRSFLFDVTIGKTIYVLKIAEVDIMDIPRTKEQWRELSLKNRAVLQGLDVSLLNFARWQLAEENPRWLLSGTKVFQVNGQTFDMGGIYLGRVGYSASLRPCFSGLSIVMEVSVSCFMKGGPLLEIMALIGNFRSVDDMVRDGCCSNPNHPFLNKVMGLLKNLKIRSKHLGQSKKLKKFSMVANDPACRFSAEKEGSTELGPALTVAEYLAAKAQIDSRYSQHMPGNKLRFPHVVTVDVGSKKKTILWPLELIVLADGQIRNSPPSEVASNLIKEAAIPPARRFSNLTQDSIRQGLFYEIQSDPNLVAFGLNNVSTTPMKVGAVILPPPKLQYGNQRVIQPELKGSWNLAGNVQFAFPAPMNPRDRRIPYGLLTVYMRSCPQRIDHAVDLFRDILERESDALGIPLKLIGNRAELVTGDDESLADVMQYFKHQGARIVVVLLYTDVYAFVKLAADRLVLPTQCVKWSNVERPPNRYHTSLLIKMNYKMGGINHTLASRAPLGMRSSEEPVFQDPPKSISWLFDEPCMVMGVDVNHPEVGQAGASVAALVASMDGKLGQYAAYVTTCLSREEPVQNLQEATSALLDAFSRRNNGATPRKIIVYRDGVSDNQFETVLEREVTAYKEALMLRGFGPDDVQIAVVMCQKRHQTRLVYQADHSMDGTGDYVNPCVGLCVDGRSYAGKNVVESEYGCINTPGLNEFYLNSHAAVLGTSKPCKYVLIYDEIGLKLTEIELFTYWTTHLYCRCTKSVSYATPAYYAHWAARRGKALLSAGASAKELGKLSEAWLMEGMPSMYYV